MYQIYFGHTPCLFTGIQFSTTPRLEPNYSMVYSCLTSLLLKRQKLDLSHGYLWYTQVYVHILETILCFLFVVYMFNGIFKKKWKKNPPTLSTMNSRLCLWVLFWDNLQKSIPVTKSLKRSRNVHIVGCQTLSHDLETRIGLVNFKAVI